MTIEEAIRAIKHDLRWNLLKDYQEDVAGIAILALEKQIPKKFEIDEWYPRDRSCPRCFEDFTKTDARCQDYEPWRYCPSCGQALDWSDTDD